ncbi:hypothetical protein CR513_14586, partial [Mucuna pruriens]
MRRCVRHSRHHVAVQHHPASIYVVVFHPCLFADQSQTLFSDSAVCSFMPRLKVVFVSLKEKVVSILGGIYS